MIAIQIRNVPKELRDVLAQDARARGMSLQQYLLEMLHQKDGAASDTELLCTWEPVRGSGSRCGRDH